MLNVSYHPLFGKEDLPALSYELRKRVKRVIETKILVKPAIFGKPLHSPLSGFWSLRVGGVRIVYGIEKELVTIYMVDSRDRVYELARKRLGF